MKHKWITKSWEKEADTEAEELPVGYDKFGIRTLF